jgi:ABC-type Na+ efflux pump permease subunit
MNYARVAAVARADLKQLVQAPDYWMPMAILGSLFFLGIPAILLFTVTRIGDPDAIGQLASTLDALPPQALEQLDGAESGRVISPQGRTGFALAVFLLAPVAVIVPLTISTAVGAAAIVGERERGTGEFLAHSPAHVGEIYLGKLVASLVPGYLTAAVGFTAYSLLVNIVVGPSVGGWFFPTAQWWVMFLWVLPPFLALCLSIVVRLSARVNSTAAAQQASGLISLPLIGIAYGQSTGTLLGGGSTAIWIGAATWALAAVSLRRGVNSVSRARLLGLADG